MKKRAYLVASFIVIILVLLNVFCTPFVPGPPPPTCSDGVKNGNETGVDCGGPDCSPCPANQGCNSDADCASGSCVNHICQSPATCSDGIKNGAETDVDCGGNQCTPCASGKQCFANSDCLSNVCTGGICQP